MISDTLLAWLPGVTDPDVDAAVRSWSPPDIDEALFQTQLHGIGPLLFHHLHVLPSWSTIPSRFKQYLTDQADLNRLRIARIKSILLGLLDRFADAHITVCPLKGSRFLLDETIDSTLRPMSDIDLLIHPGDLPRATAVLESMHFPLTETLEQHLVFGDNSTPVSFELEHPDNPITVELHPSIQFRFLGLMPQLLDITEFIWNDPAPAEGRSETLHFLNRTALFLHLGCHLAHHLDAGSPRAIQLVDLAVVARSLDEADWRDLSGLIRCSSSERQMYAAMLLAVRYAHADIPDWILAETGRGAPARLRHLLADLSLSDFAVDNELRQIKQRMRRRRPDRLLRMLAAMHRISIKRVSFCRLRPAWAHPGFERTELLRQTLFPGVAELVAWYPNWVRRRGTAAARLIHLSVLLLIPSACVLSGLRDHRRLGLMLRERISGRP